LGYLSSKLSSSYSKCNQLISQQHKQTNFTDQSPYAIDKHGASLFNQ
jgi:hypothetical protein